MWLSLQPNRTRWSERLIEASESSAIYLPLGRMLSCRALAPQ
jgi:hypothetical protein